MKQRENFFLKVVRGDSPLEIFYSKRKGEKLIVILNFKHKFFNFFRRKATKTIFSSIIFHHTVHHIYLFSIFYFFRIQEPNYSNTRGLPIKLIEFHRSFIFLPYN